MPGLTNGLVDDVNLEERPIADHVPVLVVGGGPAGLLISYMLSKFGSKCLI